MKVIFSILFLLNVLIINAQSASGNQGSSFSHLDRSFSSAVISGSSAGLQANKWKTQTTIKPDDATAWLNYYNWQDRAGADKSKKSELNDILQSASSYIAGSWQFSLMKFLQSGKRDSTSLFTAINLSDEKQSLYPYAVQYSIIKNNTRLLTEYCSDISKSTLMPPAIYEYHYNTLMSAEIGANIYAKGLNDLVPMAVLQQVYGIRKDIHLKYYEGEVTETNSYLCLSVGRDELAKYPQAAYTGLLIKINSSVPKELEKHYERNFMFKSLDAANALSAEEAAVYKNYLPAFVLLYKIYQKNNNPELSLVKTRLDKLARLTAMGDKIDQLIGDK